jgi:hypothetical protein
MTRFIMLEALIDSYAEELKLRARAGIICTFLLAIAGALRRCPPLAVLALRRVGRLASHPATKVVIEKFNQGGAPKPYDKAGFGGMQIQTVLVDEAGA